MSTPLLTVDEAAERLALSRRTVFTLIAAKTLPAVRIGRALRVEPEAVTALIDAHRTRVVAPAPTVTSLPVPSRKRFD